MAEVVRFGVFEANRKTGELRRSGARIRLQDQPFQILLMLLDRPGEVVTREEIQRRLWPEGTFVEFEHSIGTAVKKLRQALGDDADRPRYIETLPRRGFRFIAPVNSAIAEPVPTASPAKPNRVIIMGASLSVAALLAVSAWIYIRGIRVPTPPDRTLTRLTFDSGLQIGPRWSPDGRFIAFSSDRGGKFDIWVQQVGGINPVKITTRPGHNWQPDWSPDGSQIVFRSEGKGGGLFVVSALGGPERKISPFGYRPRWSSDGRWILFGNTFMSPTSKLYVLGVDGQPAREILTDFLRKTYAKSADWYPESNKIAVFGDTVWTVSMDGSDAQEYHGTPKVDEQLQKVGINWLSGVRWASSRRAIFFEGVSAGVRNLWKVTLDPGTRRLVSAERLTTGPGPDTDLAISSDGKRLAYAACQERVRIWSYPLDAVKGSVNGQGEPVTPGSVDAWEGELSGDGEKLAYVVHRSGNQELWESSMPDGPATLLAPVKPWHGSLYTLYPRWSPDAKHLAFNANINDKVGPALMPEGGGNAEAIAPKTRTGTLHDWLPDGHWFITRLDIRDVNGKGETKVLRLPLNSPSEGDTKTRVVTTTTDYIDEIRVSPDGRWLAFQGVQGRSGTTGPSGSANSTLYVMALSGGVWIPLTDGGAWDDKPRWSRDGKLIYWISSRSGFFNVWAIPFDAARGGAGGEPFQVTTFGTPRLAIADDLSLNSLSVSSARLALSMKETSGSIWVLDNVDK